MSSDNQSALRFSVEESVSFQKGQEVSELVSISIDPDIAIQEHDQYVSIRGALQLTGEYRIDESAADEEISSRDLTTSRMIHDITTRDDGVSELKHRFPVDITIPNNRIQSLDDVYVSIDSFDYELPEKYYLKLAADLSISGIYGNQQSVPTVDEDVIEKPEKVEALSRESEEEEGVADEENDQDDFDQTYQNDEIESTQFELASEEEENDTFAPFELEARRQAYFDLGDHEDSDEDKYEKPSSPNIEMKSRNEAEDNYSNKHRYQNTKVATEDEGKSAEAEKRDENALYLTKIFARDDEEEFSKLKMYIVQNGDAIDIIAENYEVSIQQLLRVNRMEHEHDVHEGQILYIPIQEGSRV